MFLTYSVLDQPWSFVHSCLTTNRPRSTEHLHFWSSSVSLYISSFSLFWFSTHRYRKQDKQINNSQKTWLSYILPLGEESKSSRALLTPIESYIVGRWKNWSLHWRDGTKGFFTDERRNVVSNPPVQNDTTNFTTAVVGLLAIIIVYEREWPAVEALISVFSFANHRTVLLGSLTSCCRTRWRFLGF